MSRKPRKGNEAELRYLGDRNVIDADGLKVGYHVVVSYREQIKELQAEIERLSNPWVSGKTRPPEKGQRVIVKYTYPSGEFSTFDGEIGYTDRLVGEEESHPIVECDWMPIPEIKE